MTIVKSFTIPILTLALGVVSILLPSMEAKAQERKILSTVFGIVGPETVVVPELVYNPAGYYTVEIKGYGFVAGGTLSLLLSNGTLLGVNHQYLNSETLTVSLPGPIDPSANFKHTVALQYSKQESIGLAGSNLVSTELFVVEISSEAEAGIGNQSFPISNVPAPNSAEILFVGHSLLNGDVVDVAVKIAASKSLELGKNLQNIPGASLKWNYNNMNSNVQNLIQSNQIDGIIMTEQMPKENQWWDCIGFDPEKCNSIPDPLIYSKKFYDEALKSNPQAYVAVTSLLPCVFTGMTQSQINQTTLCSQGGYCQCHWDNAHKHIPFKDRLESQLKYWEKMVKNINQTKLAQQPKAYHIPFSLVMRALIDEMEAGKVPGFTSHLDMFKDDVHLNQAGMDLHAITIVTAMYQQCFESVPISVSPAAAAMFYQVACDVVANYQNPE